MEFTLCKTVKPVRQNGLMFMKEIENCMVLKEGEQYNRDLVDNR